MDFRATAAARIEFDLAILFHWFWNGISIPEHYLEEIRRLSAENVSSRCLTDDQQGVREMQMAALTGQWADQERSFDFTMPRSRRCTGGRMWC